MSGNLFGDLNRDGKEDWDDDLLGMWMLETLDRQDREAAGDDDGYASSSSSGSSAAGAVVLVITTLLFLAWICSALVR